MHSDLMCGPYAVLPQGALRMFRPINEKSVRAICPEDETEHAAHPRAFHSVAAAATQYAPISPFAVDEYVVFLFTERCLNASCTATSTERRLQINKQPDVSRSMRWASSSLGIPRISRISSITLLAIEHRRTANRRFVEHHQVSTVSTADSKISWVDSAN